MKLNFFLPALLTILTLLSCQPDRKEGAEASEDPTVNTDYETPVKLIEELVGDWRLESAPERVDAAHQAGPAERLTFTEEARYVAHSGDVKIDSGSFRMNEQLKNLYLESEANKQPQEYELDLSGDRLTLKPRQATQGDAQVQASYTYRRTGAGYTPEKKGEQ